MIAPAATVVVEGTTYYRFPGVGGTWVTYDGRSVYKHKGYLYIPAGVVGLEIRYTRIPCPN